jgi:hypothetical protein
MVRTPGGIRTRDLRPYDWGALSAELQGRSPAGESYLPGRLLRPAGVAGMEPVGCPASILLGLGFYLGLLPFLAVYADHSLDAVQQFGIRGVCLLRLVHKQVEVDAFHVVRI